MSILGKICLLILGWVIFSAIIYMAGGKDSLLIIIGTDVIWLVFLLDLKIKQ